MRKIIQTSLVIILISIGSPSFTFAAENYPNSSYETLQYSDNARGNVLIGFGLEHFHLGAGYYFTETLSAFVQMDIGYRFEDLGFGVGGGLRPVEILEFQLGASYLILDREEQNSSNVQSEQITAILGAIYHASESLGVRLVYTHNLGVNLGVAIKF